MPRQIDRGVLDLDLIAKLLDQLLLKVEPVPEIYASKGQLRDYLSFGPQRRERFRTWDILPLTGTTQREVRAADGHASPLSYGLLTRFQTQNHLSMTLGPFELPAAADFHVHLRDGPMSAAVVPTIRRGGVNVAYVMPNLVPPVTTVSQALEYKKRLEALDPSVTYLMTLYLHESITPEVVREAKKAGISGIKSYPAGVTTNSSSGVLSYEPFYPVFAAMEEHGLVLNLHGEIPSDQKQGITILNAESKFLPTLKSLHSKFPKLRIVLEHCSTKDAVEAVKACGDTVVGTLTCHHLFLTVDDWAGEVVSTFWVLMPKGVLTCCSVFILQAGSQGKPSRPFTKMWRQTVLTRDRPPRTAPPSCKPSWPAKANSSSAPTARLTTSAQKRARARQLRASSLSRTPAS